MTTYKPYNKKKPTKRIFDTLHEKILKDLKWR